MKRLLRIFTDSRILAALVLLAIVALVALILWLGPRQRLFLGLAVAGVISVAVLVWLYRWLIEKIRAFRAARGMDDMVTGQADTEALRERMREVIKAIKDSRIGVARGRAALYELPWYMIIGNPAAGKSTAIINSGLKFPFADNRASVIKGIGGTRDCDWYFTTEGIILDTAGRYSVNEQDHASWLSFLKLLRKNRPRAPINGILIAASIAELNGNRPEFAINLAKSLRERVQEVTEQLGVFVPVYVIFTKSDLIAGFNEFFSDLEQGERERVWGATLPFAPRDNVDAVDQFDRHFDELAHGLKEMSLAQMARKRGESVSPGVLTLPLEFAAIKPSLRAFISTLFEDNPYQFRPVFRGFYFTSAIQEGASVKQASKRIGQRFALQAAEDDAEVSPETEQSFFLQHLFRKVIFGDRGLVRQYSNPRHTRVRYGMFFGGALILGAVLSLWTWSYMGNRALISSVHKDLQQIVTLQQGHVDLESRLKATSILQDRLQQLIAYRQDHPMAVGLGLYQGEALEAKVRAEYYSAMRRLMLQPVSDKIEAYLHKAVTHADDITVSNRSASSQQQDDPVSDAPNTYMALSPTDAEDAYNALKTYLMLGSGRQHFSVAHLRDQLPRFWRTWLGTHRGDMSRETMVETASRLMSFYLSQAQRKDWPTIENSITLVDSTRQALRRVMRGMPALDRVYADIKTRASTRFPAKTVATIVGNGDQDDTNVLVGSYAVSGTFTRKAWTQFVRPAINKAATDKLSSKDWVLDSSIQGDLSLKHNPVAIRQALVRKYKKDYIQAWRHFLQGVSVAQVDGFEQAVAFIGRLSDKQTSPLHELLKVVARQTSWDNPAAGNKHAQQAKEGFTAWLSDLISRESPSEVDVDSDAVASAAMDKVPAGKVAHAFPGIRRLMAPRDNQPRLMDVYLDALQSVSARLDKIAARGAPGRGTLKLMQQTLQGKGSEIGEAVNLVEEQVLTGLEDKQRRTLRALLLRPLVQTYAALVPPTEREINRIWQAQVLRPFHKRLAGKYPFTTGADMQASRQAIKQVFGPSGAIAQFGTEDLGKLVIRRGNTLTPRRWADVGISLAPELVVNYGLWVSALNEAGQPTSGEVKQTTFQIRPRASFAVRQYTLQIDGQRLQYRNTPPQWSTFVWPVPKGQPGVSVTALTNDGRKVTLVDAPGDHALVKLFQEGHPKRLDENSYLLTWKKNDIEVSVKLRILSKPDRTEQSTGLKGVTLPKQVAATPVDPGADRDTGKAP